MYKRKVAKVFLKSTIIIKFMKSLIPIKLKRLILIFVIYPIIFKNKFTRKTNGEMNRDKTFLVIGGYNAGLYSIIHNVVGYLIYAKKKGYVPFIDYKNNITFYHDDLMDFNLWEEYFYQPSNIDLLEINLSKNVVYSPSFFSHKYYPSNGLHVLNDKKKIIEVYEIFNYFIHYNEITKNYINEVYSNIQDMKLLGIYIRGSDYDLAKGHAKQPSMDEIFDKVDYFFEKYRDIEGIFVSTEEEETLTAIINRFGKLVHYQKRTRIKDFQDGQVTPAVFFDGLNDKIKIGREYIADIEILSRLDYFLCGLSNGSTAVIERNGLKFREYMVLFKGFNE